VFRQRAIVIKEARAELVKHHLWVLWTDYFKPQHLEQFPNLHDLFWQATKAAGTAKHSVDPGDAKKLLDLIAEIDGVFQKSKSGGSPWATKAAGPCRAGRRALGPVRRRLRADKTLAAVVREDQRLVLPAETGLVVDRQPGVTTAFGADPTDPLHFGRGRVVARAVSLDVVRAQGEPTILPIRFLRWVSAYQWNLPSVGAIPPTLAPTMYTPAGIKRVSRNSERLLRRGLWAGSGASPPAGRAALRPSPAGPGRRRRSAARAA
jgi:Nickel-containing superoxide dismutase